MSFANRNQFLKETKSTLKKCLDPKSSNKRRKTVDSTNLYITPFTLFSPFKSSMASEVDAYCYITPKKINKGKLNIYKLNSKENPKKNQAVEGFTVDYVMDIVIKKIKK